MQSQLQSTCGEQQTPLPNAGGCGTSVTCLHDPFWRQHQGWSQGWFWVSAHTTHLYFFHKSRRLRLHSNLSLLTCLLCEDGRRAHSRGPSGSLEYLFSNIVIKNRGCTGWGERKGGAVRFSPSHSSHLSSPADPGNTQVQILSHLNLLMVNKIK